MTAGSERREAWRVEILEDKTAGHGLIAGCICPFTIRHYWDYGSFHPQECCDLPGGLFVATASAQEGCSDVYLTPSFWGRDNLYTLGNQNLYIAWRVRSPQKKVRGGKFSFVRPHRGPWQVWCNKDEDERIVWAVNVMQRGESKNHRMRGEVVDGEWVDVQLILTPGSLELELNGRTAGTYEHDSYEEPFTMRFGSAQESCGGEVVSEFKHVYVNDVPYPYSRPDARKGPEDNRPQDCVLNDCVVEATAQRPRHSEGDMIALKDGSLLLVWTDYFMGEGSDDSPARLSSLTSEDGGKTWARPNVVVDYEPNSPGGNVMSVSLERAGNGELLMAYWDQTPEMETKGMVLRRSCDDGKTWSSPEPMTRDNGNAHAANNGCFRMLATGRIILACREYVEGTRWPYVLYSDDDGRTWRMGKHVPDPGSPRKLRAAQNVNEPSVAELPDGRLLMTMRSVAGGQFFSYSGDGGESWTKPRLSPLRGVCSPATIRGIPGSSDILAVWNYSLASRSPLHSAVSSDCGKSWRHLKLIEQSPYYGYHYTSITFIGDRAYLLYSEYPLFESLCRSKTRTSHSGLKLTVLPIEWFCRSAQAE